MTCPVSVTFTSRDRLNGQRVMYPTRRSMPGLSPAGRYTDWSTLKPLCGQVRMLSTTSGSELLKENRRLEVKLAGLKA